MKKFLAIVAVMVAAVMSLSARDKVYRTADVLPAPAKKVLAESFGKTGVSHVKVEEHAFGGNDYEVILNDGTEIDFNSKGEWTDVDCGQREVPSAFILKPIASYVRSNFKGAKIVKIDKGRNDYEVELTNGKELKFDRAGRFLRVDD